MSEKMIHSGTLDPQISEREKKHGQLARKMAAEGIVLLKNEGILPLDVTTPVALLGKGAVKTVKGGIGSGDVNNRANVSIYEGMQKAGAAFVNEGWLQEYDACYMAARYAWKDVVLEAVKEAYNPFDAYASHPFVLPEGRRFTKEEVEGAKAAVYVVSRIAGEGKDRRAIKGDYYLSDQEKEEILFLDQNQIPTILIVNAGGPVELTDILEEAGCVQAVLNISQLGQEGGHAVADVLFGKAVPGGRLTSTWAKRYADQPYAEDYSYLNGNLEKEEYKEGIFVGYRYFDTFGVKPLFPFGFGLSYTTFDMKAVEVRAKEGKVEVDVLVKNTGDVYSGREVVQVYITPPQDGMVKEYHRLAGFVKTKELGPGEEQKVTVGVEQKQLASYSEAFHGWVVEKGVYGVWVGQHSASLDLAAILNVEESVMIEQNHAICLKQEAFEELDASEVVKGAAWLEEGKEQGVPELVYVPQEEEKRVCPEHFATEQSVEELIPALYGNITEGTITLGNAGKRVPGSAGETTERLEEKYGIPSLIMADGPAGLRLRSYYEVDRATDEVHPIGFLGSLENGFLEPVEHHEGADGYHQYCTAFPVGTALAQTWDLELMQQFGEAVGVEMEEFGVNLWLAPGLNIHRNPLCGRNFEYYSEDPLLSGSMAAAATRGVQSKKGCGVTIKHFSGNNQEDNRMGVNMCASERALREIYFRGFEIAVKKGDPRAIMTSYNLINGIHAANHYELCTVLAREEWGFDGIIMTDWNTTLPDGGSIPWKCVTAGNDVIMPGCPADDKNIREAYEKGLLTEEDIRKCAGRVIALAKRLSE